MKELLLEAVFKCKYILKEPPPVVRLTDASTQPYTYMVWVYFSNYPAMYRGREELYREIHNSLKLAGIGPAAEIQEWRTRRAEIPNAEPPTIQLALKSLDLFSNFTEEEIEKIALASQRLNFEADSNIIMEGDTQDALDIITSGAVELLIQSAEGKKTAVGQLTTGQYFGLVSMLTNQPSMFEYRALTDLSVIRINLECMQNVIKKHPDLADQYAAIVNQRLEEATFLRGLNDLQHTRTPKQQVKRIIKKLIT